MKKSISWLIGFAVLIITGAYISSCNKNNLPDLNNNMSFPATLSEWNVYKRPLNQLEPVASYQLYELPGGLFTDHAEKQRLISVPAGQVLTPQGDDLFRFPDSTILVKTFFYYADKTNPGKGKKIIETRLLVLHKGNWNAATYVWNDNQTEAHLAAGSLNKPVSWVDEFGETNAITYHIPSGNECASCHNSKKQVIPLGPKLRNLNHEVTRNGLTLNQLVYLKNTGVIGYVDPASHSSLPDYKNLSASLEQRARAYLDLNCAHCHSTNGMAAKKSNLRLSYETSLRDSRLEHKGLAIPLLMERKIMPKLGTTVVDWEGLELVKKYLKEL